MKTRDGGSVPNRLLGTKGSVGFLMVQNLENLLNHKPHIAALMSLSCCIRGSFSAWESWWVAAEGE